MVELVRSQSKVGIIEKTGSRIGLFMLSSQLIIEEVLDLATSRDVSDDAREETKPYPKVLGVLWTKHAPAIRASSE